VHEHHHGCSAGPNVSKSVHLSSPLSHLKAQVLDQAAKRLQVHDLTKAKEQEVQLLQSLQVLDLVVQVDPAGESHATQVHAL
jgi:hypothetical protein